MRVRRHRRLQKSYRHTHAAHYSFSLLAAMQFESPTTPLPPIHALYMECDATAARSGRTIELSYGARSRAERFRLRFISRR